MKTFQEGRGTFREPGKYNFLLLIIIPLLIFSRESMMHKDEQGKCNSLLPAKGGTLFIQTFPGVYCADPELNYHVWGSSTYQDVCRLTKLLLPAIYVVWGNSTYQDVCRLTKLLFLAIYVVRGSSTHQEVCPSNFEQMNPSPLPTIGGTFSIQDLLAKGVFQAILGKCSQGQKHRGGSSRSLFIPGILVSIIQWPSNKIATFQEKVKQSKLQWPPEKVATMQTMTNSN